MRLMNAFGDAAEHVVLSAMPDRLGARDGDRAAASRSTFPADAPPLTGRPTPPRLWRLARYMRGFDLVLTYNWGAFDAVMARRLFGGPPLVHHEDGFNEDEAGELKPARNLYRRLGLRRRLPAGRAVGAAGEDRAARPGGRRRADRADRQRRRRSRASPGRRRPARSRASSARPGEIVIGTVAGLRAVKNLPRLVRAFAAMTHRQARLVIVGEGPESERIAAEARARGRRRAAADARLPRRSGALDRPFRHLRFVVGQRAIPDLAGRGDGGGAAGGGDRGRRRAARWSPTTTGR